MRTTAKTTTKPIARALAYQWGEMQERPPNFIDDLMIDLTEALTEAQASGNVERAQCLGEVLQILAEGIVKYEHPAGPALEGETLSRAVTELRTYYYLESVSEGEGRELEKLGKGREAFIGDFFECGTERAD